MSYYLVLNKLKKKNQKIMGNTDEIKFKKYTVA